LALELVPEWERAPELALVLVLVARP